jgi:hypothetical protein
MKLINAYRIVVGKHERTDYVTDLCADWRIILN